MRFSLHQRRLAYGEGLTVFTASSGPVTGLEELYLNVRWDGGEGWGEARANIRYASGLEPERLPALVAEVAAPLASATTPEAALDALADAPAHPMARNIVDCALLDGAARAAGIAVASLLGATLSDGAPPPVPSNQCIFAGTPVEQAATRAARYAAEGFREIKIRLGVEPPAREAERVRAIRAAVGDAVRLAVDANGTWGVEEAVLRLGLLEGLAIAYVEQPTAPGDWAGFAAVHARTGLPVMADEGLRGDSDVEALMRLGPPFLAHLKLPKAGGPRALLAQARRLAAAGVGLMVGQMNEGALATAAAVQCALAVRPAHAELYGAYGLADDPAQGLAYRGGAACLAGRTGMGVAIAPAALPPPLWTIGA